MSDLRRFLWAMTVAALALALLFGLHALAKRRPQDLPWTPLDLGETPGLFTGRKLAGLTGDFRRCRALLAGAGVRYTVLAPLREEGHCGYDDGIRVDGGARTIALAPARPGMACPVAAALTMLERAVVQPAAGRRFGQPVRAIEHFGTYNCRRMYGRTRGSWSEHATADALDIAGFVLADGTRVSVVKDWSGKESKAAFLRDVRDGACRLFSTVLSPDYNAAHRDHLHLDQAERGEVGWRSCR